jgi:YidC/Oxa1 family membrane protein insertase
MERRFVLAITLMIAVLVVPSFFVKRPPPRRPTADSSAIQPTGAPAPLSTPTAGPPGIAPTRSAAATPAATIPASADTVSLGLHAASYRFNAVGATLDQAVFGDYKDYSSGQRGNPARLVRPGDRMLARRLVVGNDTLRMDDVAFAQRKDADVITMVGQAGGLTESVRVTPVEGRQYLLDVSGEITGLEGRGALLILGLGTGFAQMEADSNDNYHNYAVAVRRTRPENTNFRSVDPGVAQAVPGPLDWVAVKSKYFMGAVLSADSMRPQFGGALLVGGPRPNRTATSMETWVTMSIGADGRYRYQLYLGPQYQRVLEPLGRELDRASPYGWVFRPIVMPVASWFTRLLLWMHESLRLSYGLALVVFGILVRLVLWPLNQRAMKSQVAMMAVQPILKDLQARHKDEPQKLQAEMMKVYKEHSVNPLGGCLPLLLPMPVLLALFFVFSRAIELRGTSFLWLPDLSLRDPLYITPIVMGASMWALSKLSQAGMPPNPQAKMMTTIMPVMMTVMFLNFASGLNLYYAVSNIVSLPQQYLINKSRMAEMARRQVASSGKKTS